MPILDIRNANPQEGANYILDANVWIFMCGGTVLSYQNSYINFVSKIRRMNPESAAKIILPASVLSEVVNRMMKDVLMQEFARQFPLAIDPKYSSRGSNAIFKHCYRSHPQYNQDFGMLLADINAYGSYIVTVSDDFNGTTLDQLISDPPIQLDFTDYTISRLARDNNYIIITDDGDFKGDNNHILTVNRNLLGAS